VEVEFVLGMQRSESFHELAPEHFFEHIHWQEELLLRVDPPRMVRRHELWVYLIDSYSHGEWFQANLWRTNAPIDERLMKGLFE
jgi:hypothetical protein